MATQKPKSDREILIEFRNDWREKLIAASIDQKHAERTAMTDPKFVNKTVSPNRQLIEEPILATVERKKKDKAWYVQHVEIIDVLIEMEKRGLLDELWSPVALEPVPVDPVDVPKEPEA